MEQKILLSFNKVFPFYNQFNRKPVAMMSKKKNKQKQEQDQKMKQKMKQQQQQNDTISNIGNPTINVNVTAGSTPSSDTNIVSAFKATATQDVPVNTFITKVFFPNEIFDLADEYDPTTSIFTPKQSGVYTITASVNFVKNPEFFANTSDTAIIIRVNNQSVDLEDDFVLNLANQSSSQVTQVSDVLLLNAGDQVEVFFAPAFFGASGEILGNVGTSFSAGRLPSPAQ